MYTPEQVAVIKSTLIQFSGTQNYYRTTFFTKSIVHTDGANYVAKTFGAGWLLDAIASHQVNARVKREDFQVWTLHVGSTQEHPVKQSIAAILICEDGNGHEVTRQNIPYTDFPLPEFTLYLERGSLDGETECQIIMLPSER